MKLFNRDLWDLFHILCLVQRPTKESHPSCVCRMIGVGASCERACVPRLMVRSAADRSNGIARDGLPPAREHSKTKNYTPKARFIFCNLCPKAMNFRLFPAVNIAPSVIFRPDASFGTVDAHGRAVTLLSCPICQRAV